MPYHWWTPLFDSLAALGIEPHEVVQVLRYAYRLPVPASTDLGPALTIWGRTRNGRGLVVLVRPLGGFDHQIIGVREMTTAEDALMTNHETRKKEQ